ncbi:hypothetical protein OBV_22180 [Oscillibacter valericigenes Sjm18-20]|nr:hypothetical protein OBV_22180 [Oscillibacter valericigenes Sjm18-20]
MCLAPVPRKLQKRGGPANAASFRTGKQRTAWFHARYRFCDFYQNLYFTPNFSENGADGIRAGRIAPGAQM